MSTAPASASSMQPPTELPVAPSATQTSTRRRWLRIAAVGSFLFFLIKGLVWLGVVGAAIFQIAS